MNDLVPVTLATLLGGAVEERFQEALEKTLRNLRDPNTSGKTKRRISITLDVAAYSDDRKVLSVDANITTRVATDKPVTGAVFLDASGQLLQPALPTTPEADPRQGLLIHPSAK